MREELPVKIYLDKKGTETFTVHLLSEKTITLNEGDFLVFEHRFENPDNPEVQVYIDRKEEDD